MTTKKEEKEKRMIGTAFDGIIGATEIKIELMKMVSHILDPETMPRDQVAKNILIVGGPGTGKTMLGRALNKALGEKCVYIDVCELWPSELIIEGASIPFYVYSGPVSLSDKRCAIFSEILNGLNKKTPIVLFLESLFDLSDGDYLEAMKHLGVILNQKESNVFVVVTACKIQNIFLKFERIMKIPSLTRNELKRCFVFTQEQWLNKEMFGCDKINFDEIVELAKFGYGGGKHFGKMFIGPHNLFEICSYSGEIDIGSNNENGEITIFTPLTINFVFWIASKYARREKRRIIYQDDLKEAIRYIIERGFQLSNGFAYCNSM